MTCREIYAFLDDFLIKALDPSTHMAFKAHLALCSSCRRYLSTYVATIEAAKTAEAAGEVADIEPPEALVQAILASRASAFGRPRAE